MGLRLSDDDVIDGTPSFRPLSRVTLSMKKRSRLRWGHVTPVVKTYVSHTDREPPSNSFGRRNPQPTPIPLPLPKDLGPRP